MDSKRLVRSTKDVGPLDSSGSSFARLALPTAKRWSRAAYVKRNR